MLDTGFIWAILEPMKVLSLFSGVGGFDMGLEAAGFETIFQCEWDKHCTKVLEKHWPNVPKWGDVSTLTGAHVLEMAGSPDVVAWGSPCQDLSVAGKRAGLSGAKSGLFHEGIRIIKEIRELTNNEYPRFSIWENVPGALSSNGGADFGVVLDEMAQAGALELEWAVLDAQYFGVAQRRRRIFLTSVFRPSDATRSRGKIFPVAEGVFRNSKTRGKKGQSATTTTTGGTGTSSDEGASGAVAFQPGTLIRATGGHWDEQAPTLRAESKSGDNSPHVAQPFVKSRHAKDAEDYETWIDGNVSPTLNTFENHSDTRATVAIVHQEVVNDVAATITANYSKQIINSMAEEGNLFPITVIDRAAFNQGPNAQYDTIIREDTAIPALVARGPHAVGQHVSNDEDIVFHAHRQDGVRLQENGTVNTLTAFMGTGGLNTPMVAQNGTPATGFEPGAMSRLESPHYWEEMSPTLRAQMGDNQASVAIPIQDGREIEKSQNGLGVGDAGMPAYTIDTTGAQAVAIPIDTRNALRDPEKYDEQNRQGLGVGSNGDPMATLTSTHVNAVAYSVREDAIADTFSATPIDVANAVTALQPSPQSHHAQVFITQPTDSEMYSFDTQFGSNAAVFEGQAPTLKATQAPASVAYQYDGYNQKLEVGDGVYRSLRVGRDPSDFVINGTAMIIRRLTPLECERLMGWPDNHTKYNSEGKIVPDTQRYKMCGNGVASPCATWVAEKIKDVYLGQQP